MDNRNVAIGLAGIRMGIGAALVVAPTFTAGCGSGPALTGRAARCSPRALGAHDVVLGYRTFRAALDGEEVEGWLEIGAMADAADTVAAGVAYAGIIGHRRYSMPLISSAMGAACLWAARQGSGTAQDAADDVAPTGDSSNDDTRPSHTAALPAERTTHTSALRPTPPRSRSSGLLRRLAAAYRRTGADVPYGDPLPSHGTEMEGWFWRFTDQTSGRVVVALCGVNRHPGGDWATVAVAVHPGQVVRSAVLDLADASRDELLLSAGAATVTSSKPPPISSTSSWRTSDSMSSSPTPSTGRRDSAVAACSRLCRT